MGSITDLANMVEAAEVQYRDDASVSVGLIGRGIAQSESPAIHEVEARAQGLSLIYHLVDFDALGFADDKLPLVLNFLAGIGFAGVNITFPFKQAVLGLLDEINPTAAALGAVNCVAFADGRKVGWNSDWTGFGWLLESELPNAKLDLVAQLGAGGAGSAVAYALLKAGVRTLRLFDRSVERSHALKVRLEPLFPQQTIEVSASAEAAIEGASGLVQATPIGMAHHPGLPCDPRILSAQQWVADVIYFPRETALLKAARVLSLRTANGEAMVIGQAAEAFRMFTGMEPDRGRMAQAFRQREAERLEQVN